jgi:hypothetical protein
LEEDLEDKNIDSKDQADKEPRTHFHLEEQEVKEDLEE